MDDAALVRLILAGQTDRYTELVQRWAGRVVALCHARTRRADLAEELAQETLVRGLEELPSLVDPTRFGPWLAGIALNTCRDWFKRHQNAQVPLSTLAQSDLLPASGASPDTLAEEADETERLLRAVDALPEECRVVLLLFYYEAMSHREIAQVLDLSPTTVNARLCRARMLLRGRLCPGTPVPTLPEAVQPLTPDQPRG